MLLLLDSGPLGLLSNPTREGPGRLAREWAAVRIQSGDEVIIPEIADYEVRRELLRAGKARGLERLDALCDGLAYEPLTTSIMRTAAGLWADARNAGAPTALALDGDVILAAQALSLVGRADAVVVATTNPKHLARYVDARAWSEI